MKTRSVLCSAVVAAVVGGAAPVWAAAQGEGAGGWGLWTIVFLAFGAMVILAQVVPAVVMLGAMVRALFGRAPRETTETEEIL